jgi:hypothetical protein
MLFCHAQFSRGYCAQHLHLVHGSGQGPKGPRAASSRPSSGAASSQPSSSSSKQMHGRSVSACTRMHICIHQQNRRLTRTHTCAKESLCSLLSLYLSLYLLLTSLPPLPASFLAQKFVRESYCRRPARRGRAPRVTRINIIIEMFLSAPLPVVWARSGGYFYTVVTLLYHCCHTVVPLLLHCRYTVVPLLSHCCHTVVPLLLHCPPPLSMGKERWLCSMQPSYTYTHTHIHTHTHTHTHVHRMGKERWLCSMQPSSKYSPTAFVLWKFAINGCVYCLELAHETSLHTCEVIDPCPPPPLPLPPSLPARFPRPPCHWHLGNKPNLKDRTVVRLPLFTRLIILKCILSSLGSLGILHGPFWLPPFHPLPFARAPPLANLVCGTPFLAYQSSPAIPTCPPCFYKKKSLLIRFA